MSDSDDEDFSLPAGMKPVPRATPTLVSERGARPLAPPAVEQSEPPPGLITPLPRPEPPPAMQPPPPPPMNRDGVVVDQAASGACHLCSKPSGEKMLKVSYRATPLIAVRIAICLSCLRNLVLDELDRHRKLADDARRAEDEAEGGKYGFGKRELRELALQGFGRPVAQKMSPEFISAAIDLAGRLRRDWYLGYASSLSHETLQALQALLEALGTRLESGAR
jgi:hypothetical protein